MGVGGGGNGVRDENPVPRRNLSSERMSDGRYINPAGSGNWIRRDWMLQEYDQKFRKRGLPLSSGGVFDLDAVSEDNKIVANTSTSGATTASGRPAVGKLMKIRADMYFLLLVDAERKLVVFSEPDMLELCQREARIGRVPSSIEFVHAKIPGELATRLQGARKVAFGEVTPASGR